MKIGFTGTQEGMTDFQLQTLLKEVLKVDRSEQITEIHHGDCIGADEQLSISMPVCLQIIHPPNSDVKRAFCKGKEYREPKDYIIRNHDIVNASDILFVAPRSMKEELRSGTWATYRYARKMNKPYVIVFPNGNVERGF